MNEVNNLLKRLGELEDAPLIWVNKKVYDMADEIQRLKEDIRVFKFTIKTQQEQIQELIAREDKAIEEIKSVQKDLEEAEGYYYDWLDKSIQILRGEDNE